jgi:trehalose 6-phosphate synthase/phosphatase
MGIDNTLGQLLVGDRVVHVDVFPMGIDFQKYSDAKDNPSLQEDFQRVRTRMGNRRVVFTVSRLDYTKGIPESLEAVKAFLDCSPEWHEKVLFVLVVVPSRESVESYASLKRKIDEMVGRLNSEYGSLDWVPIHYIYRSLSFGELVGLYAHSDVALITPLRDGMNLIAKEYLAARPDETGVLVISEMAGASKELVEAITVHPSSREEIAHALQKALAMPVEEQRRRNARMRQRLQAQDIHHWVRRFFDKLKEAVKASALLSVKLLDQVSRNKLLQDYRAARRRMIVLDYDGTLVPFADEPSLARPDAELIATLKKLQAVPATDVVVLSGRDRYTLEKWLGGSGAMLVAEHGAWLWTPREREWKALSGSPENGWKKEVRPILDLFVDRIPGSFVEEKSYSLVWHFRKAEQESAGVAAREMLDTVANFAVNLPIQVLPGNKTIEVRSFGINKGIFFKRVVATAEPDFILAAGDDWTDEDLFAVLPDTAYSIKVGMRMSRARFNLRSFHDLRTLLQSLEG